MAVLKAWNLQESINTVSNKADCLTAAGYDIRTIYKFPGQKDISVTMIYTHVLNRGGKGVKSPADDR